MRTLVGRFVSMQSQSSSMCRDSLGSRRAAMLVAPEALSTSLSKDVNYIVRSRLRTTSDSSGLTIKALLSNRIQRHRSGLPCKLRFYRYPHILDKRTNRILAMLSDCQHWSPDIARALNDLKIRLGWRVVREVLKSLSYVSVAVGFFSWARQQRNFRHNTKTYAVITRLAGESGDFKLMYTFLLQMHEDRCVVTPFFFADMIMAYGRSGMVKEACLVFKQMRAAGCRPNRFVYNCLISVLTRYGFLDGAELLYEKMGCVKCCYPDTVTSNILIDTYGKSGNVLEAQHCLLKMKQKGIQPNEKSYASLIGSFHRAGKLEKACEIFEEIQSKEFLVNRVTYTEVLRGLGKAGKLERALRVFGEMEDAGCTSDVVVYNILIDALAKRGLITEAWKIFTSMEGKGCPPNEVTYNSLINGFCKVRKMDEALRWCESMKQQGIRPSYHTYAIIIGGYCKAAQWDAAYQFLMEMERSLCTKRASNMEAGVQAECCGTGFTSSVFVHNVMLGGLVKAGKLETACALFETMQEKGSCPDVVSYSIMIHGLGNAGKISDALHTYKRMKDSGLKPNLITCNTLIHVCQKAGRTSDVREIVNEMLSLGLKPDIITYTSLCAPVGGHSKSLQRQQNAVLKHRFDRILGIKNVKD